MRAPSCKKGACPRPLNHKDWYSNEFRLQELYGDAMAKNETGLGHDPTGLRGNNRVTHQNNGSLFAKRYVTVDEVPEQYKEKFLLTGYRQPYSSFLDCIVSVFRLNNETLNVWTHFLPFLVLSVGFWKTFPSSLWPASSISNKHYPILVEEISALTYLLFSSVAHLCNCMSPRIRHICFYFDYAAICVYGVGTSCAVFYTHPLKSEFIFFHSWSLYVTTAFLCNVLACSINCASRHRWIKFKYLVRTVAWILPFTTVHSPTYYRVVECVFTGEECTSGLPYGVVAWMFYLLAAVLNATRFPECHYPRTFDIFGHNHQWMHVVTAVGTVAHIVFITRDLAEREDLLSESLQEVSLAASLGWLFGVIAASGAVVLWFGSCLTPSGHLKSDKQKQ